MGLQDPTVGVGIGIAVGFGGGGVAVGFGGGGVAVGIGTGQLMFTVAGIAPPLVPQT